MVSKYKYQSITDLKLEAWSYREGSQLVLQSGFPVVFLVLLESCDSGQSVSYLKVSKMLLFIAGWQCYNYHVSEVLAGEPQKLQFRIQPWTPNRVSPPARLSARQRPAGTGLAPTSRLPPGSAPTLSRRVRGPQGARRGLAVVTIPSAWARGVWDRLTGYLRQSTEPTAGCWASRRTERSWCGGRSEMVGWPWPKDSPWWLSRSLAALSWRRWVQQFTEGWLNKNTLTSGAHVAELVLHMRRARKSPCWM